jgi:putative peptide zinc metalloprotease protein
MRAFMLMLAAAAALCLTVAKPPPADAGDNTAVVVNLRDDSSTFRLAFKITRVNRDVVDSSNAAVAAASCTDCQTVAVAIQAVLIFSEPSVVTPTNFAFAFNLECERCYTLATAYQFVSTTGIVHFSAEGNRRIAVIRRKLEALRNANLSIEEIQARVDDLAGDLLDVMRTELVAPGRGTTPSEAGPVDGTAPSETTQSSTETTPPTTTEVEPAPTEQPTETTQTADAVETQSAESTEANGTDAAAGDSSSATASSPTTGDTSATTTEPVAETTTP